MLQKLAMLALPFVVFMASNLADAATPPWVRVRNIGWAGSGCPAGSTTYNLSPDQLAFTMTFDQNVAEIGPGVPFNQRRKNCQITVDLDFPSGWSYSLVTVDYRGYASLENGVTGTQQASYYFQGGFSKSMATNLRGPHDRNYQVRDTLQLSDYVWSPCGAQRALNINSEIRLASTNSNRRGVITIDSIDGSFKTLYGLAWRPCR